MVDNKFDLGDYVQVKDRIAKFYELYGGGRLVTGEVRLSNEPDGVPRVIVQGLAYRTPDDPHPGIGWSWMELPGKTPYTKGSEIENAETSAWGRAIGSLGILIDKSIASANEIDSKQDDGKAAKVPTVESVEGGLIGIASLGKAGPVDGLLRATPNGPSIGFVLGEGREKVQVVAYEALADALLPLLPTFIGQRVQVYGPVSVETMRVGNYDRKYPRLTLIQIKTEDWTLPSIGPVAVPTEAESIPAFDDDLDRAAREWAAR